MEGLTFLLSLHPTPAPSSTTTLLSVWQVEGLPKLSNRKMGGGTNSDAGNKLLSSLLNFVPWLSLFIQHVTIKTEMEEPNSNKK